MSSLQFLTREAYLDTAERIGGSHWANARHRWKYHSWAVHTLTAFPPDHPEEVLELGTMGVSIVTGSHTMDFREKWSARRFSPRYHHDARKIPWPLKDKQYHTLIALRVFQHLSPVQKECFAEARRVARNVLIVSPEVYEVPGFETSAGITEHDFIEWSDGVEPTVVVRFPEKWIGKLYYWHKLS